jgi:hypothetical protein
MPKDVSERIIDSPFTPTTRVGSVAIGGGGGGGGGGATNLDALTDVTLSAPSSGQTLSYNSGTGQWINSAPAAMTAHNLSGSYHTGQLNWSLINFGLDSDLADIAIRQHSDLQGIAPNDHHNQAHVLATGTALGVDHTISGAAAGEVLRALSATTAAFDILQHTDLGNILPDQHHTRAHDIITGDASGAVHTVVGGDFTVVGVHPANTLALLPTSSAPGAAVSILKTDANGAIQLDTNLFYVDGANNRIGVNVIPGAGLKGGAAALDIRAGTGGDITQRIRQLPGQTGRLWRIEDVNGDELIVLDSVGNLQSGYSHVSGGPGFVSGMLGWRITPQGDAEFNNIWARGELHATVFVKDEVHATGGTFYVASSGVLFNDAAISSSIVDDDVLVVYSTPAGAGVPLQVVTTSGTFVGNELHVSFIGNFIDIEDPRSGPAFYFQPGDVIRVKTEINPEPPDTLRLADLWLEVNGAIQKDGYATYSVFKRRGSDCTIPKGTAMVSYGKEGDGRILMTSDLQNAPYLDVFTTGYQVWTGNADSQIPRVRLGRLDGLPLPGLSGIEQYGMAAGKNLGDPSGGYFIASNLGVSLYRVPIRLSDGTNATGLWTPEGNFFLGTNIGSDPVNTPMAATTGLRVYTTGGGGNSPGDVIIGNEALDNYIKWSQVSGLLTVHGSLTVSGGGAGATVGYVDGKDMEYDAKANLSPTGYAGIAQTNSQGYGSARRIVGVSGSWDSLATNQLKWGTKAGPGGTSLGGTALKASFADGSTRDIADHAGSFVSISSRTYLFVNVNAGGTLTLNTTTSAAAVAASPNYVLIAVADPGAKVSISIVAGSTYISGGNIFTESIVAGNIAVGSITADRLVTGTITSSYLDPAYTSAVNSGISTADAKAVTADGKAVTADAKAVTADAKAVTADAKAVAADAKAVAADAKAVAADTKAQQGIDAAADNKLYGDQRRLLNVGGSFVGINGNTVAWGTPTALQANFASGLVRTITASAPPPTGVTLSPAGRWYFYVDVGSGTGALTMQAPTRTLGDLGVNDVLIAVVDTSTLGPTPVASIQIVAGSTYISGGNIMTGSIVTSNIAASAITAGLISVANLQAVSANTGALSVTGIITMGTSGNIQTSGKTSYADTTAGVFLGWDGGGVPAYKFGIGDANSYLRWGGPGLPVEIRSVGGININAAASASEAIRFLRTAGDIKLYHETDPVRSSRIRSDGIWAFDWEVYARKFVVEHDTFQIETKRAVAHDNSTGFPGEICWDLDATGHLWLYLCGATNNWRRIEFPITFW